MSDAASMLLHCALHLLVLGGNAIGFHLPRDIAVMDAFASQEGQTYVNNRGPYFNTKKPDPRAWGCCGSGYLPGKASPAPAPATCHQQSGFVWPKFAIYGAVPDVIRTNPVERRPVETFCAVCLEALARRASLQRRHPGRTAAPKGFEPVGA